MGYISHSKQSLSQFSWFKPKKLPPTSARSSENENGVFDPLAKLPGLERELDG